MTSQLESELFRHAQLALDERRRPLDDEAVLAVLDELLTTSAPAPQLQTWLAELAALEVASETLSATKKRSRIWPLVASLVAASVLLFAALNSHPGPAPKPSPDPVQIASSPLPMHPAPRAEIKSLSVTVRRQESSFHRAGQSIQTTTTRSLHKPR